MEESTKSCLIKMKSFVYHLWRKYIFNKIAAYLEFKYTFDLKIELRLNLSLNMHLNLRLSIRPLGYPA